MDCFDSTCAFSRAGISEGDQILMVALQVTTITWDTYTLVERCFSLQRASLDLSELFRFVGVGTYNSYGSIEGYDHHLDSKQEKVAKGKNWSDYQFLVHKEIAEGVLGRDLGTTDSELKKDAADLIYKAHAARVQLMGNDLLGGQLVDLDEVNLQLRVLNLSLNFLVNRQRELESWLELEDEDEG